MSEQCTSKLGWIALDTWSWGVCMREWIPEQCAAGGEVEDSRAAGWPATGVEVDHHGGRARMATEESPTRRLRPCRSLSMSANALRSAAGHRNRSHPQEANEPGTVGKIALAVRRAGCLTVRFLRA